MFVGSVLLLFSSGDSTALQRPLDLYYIITLSYYLKLSSWMMQLSLYLPTYLHCATLLQASGSFLFVYSIFFFYDATVMNSALQ